MKERILEKKEIRFEYTVTEITHDVESENVPHDATTATPMSFEDCSWSEFAKIARTGKARDRFNISDKKQVLLKNGEIVRIAIAGFDHDVTEDGKTLPVTLTFVDCLAEEFVMNQTATNKSGWKGCAMRNKTMAAIFELLPDDLQEIIVACHKDNITVDKLFPPSEYEVWGKNHYGDDDGSNKQYEFFKDKYNRIKFNTDNEEHSTWWWLRSPISGNYYDWCVVSSNGGYNDSGANSSNGVAPCFAIG